MKTASSLRRPADLLSIGLLVAFTGCTSPALQQTTSEASLSPASGTPVPRDFDPPKPLHIVKPDYPFDMKRAGLSGVVAVNCLIDQNGRVQDARVENANTPGTAFSTSALEAIRQWTFTPAIRNGTPIAVRVTLPMSFVLAED